MDKTQSTNGTEVKTRESKVVFEAMKAIKEECGKIKCKYCYANKECELYLVGMPYSWNVDE